MKKDSEITEYRSPDLYYSSYLQTSGVPMIRTEREGNRVFFIFDTSIADMDALKTAWFNGTGKVPAQAYAMAVRNLKALVHTP